MMADDEVLNQCLERVRETWHLNELRLQHLQFDDHVPKQLTPRTVGKGAIVSELVDLADIMQEGAGEQQITVHLRIVAAHEVAGVAQRDDVLKQAADERMMQGLGGGRIAVSFGAFRIGHASLNQRLEMGVLESSDEARQSPP